VRGSFRSVPDLDPDFDHDPDFDFERDPERDHDPLTRPRTPLVDSS